MMQPGAILDGLEFSPTKLRFGILDGAFDKVALGFAEGKDIERGVGWCVGQGIRQP